MAKKIALLGILASLAIIAGLLERLVPFPIAVPGIKLGLANVIVIITMYCMGEREAFGISVIRIMVVGVLFSGLSGILYSLAGGLLSYVGMVAGKRVKAFSVIGVSIIGGVLHNLGQIGIAALVVSNIKLLYYVPVLILAGIVAGVVTGFVAVYTLDHMGVICKSEQHCIK